MNREELRPSNEPVPRSDYVEMKHRAQKAESALAAEKERADRAESKLDRIRPIRIYGDHNMPKATVWPMTATEAFEWLARQHKGPES